MTIKSVLGILRPDEGQIFVDGEEVTHIGGRKRDRVLRQSACVSRARPLFDSLTVWENVAFGLIQGRGMGASRPKDIAVQKLAKVGLGAEVASLSPSELSGGMQKRVGLARAIAADPQIIFFDEPTTGLDPIMADIINDLIVDTSERRGRHDTVDHPRHGQRPQDRRPHRHALQGKIIWHGR